MKKNVFAITGYSCAGKSTLITELINNSRADIVRYGEIHWRAIRSSGYNLGIDWIKERGFEEYEERALTFFKQELGSCNSNAIIVDGIFSYKCFEYLKSRKDIELTNILLETSFDKRLIRMMQREGYSEDDAEERLKSVDWLKGNAGLIRIMEQADFRINGETDKEKITGQVLQIVARVLDREERGK